MAEPVQKRRRQQYSKLICFGCRGRRIRCALPDTNIQPSPQPQPHDKACQRCRSNGLDCIVDSTTLGRPTQKRSHSEGPNFDGISHQPSRANYHGSKHTARTTAEDDPSLEVHDFLLTQNEPLDSDMNIKKSVQHSRLSKNELGETMKNSYYLLSAMLSRDKKFASSIGSQPMTEASIVELVDESTAELLDEHLVWHKLHYPAIPNLAVLRREVIASGAGSSSRTSGLFLLTLLCDLALDVPSPRLTPVRSLQPLVRALLYQCGQTALFSLPRNSDTVLALALTTQYRPLALTNSQTASSQTLKAIPHLILEKYVASELEYSTAGSRLFANLRDLDRSDEEMKSTMLQCRDWVRLSIAEDLQGGIWGTWTRKISPSAIECLDALSAAADCGRMPLDVILPYSSQLYATQIIANLRDMTENWKDLPHLEEVIIGHQVFCDREKGALEQLLGRFPSDDKNDLPSVISHIAEMERHNSHTAVVGAALFFSIMSGVHAKTHSGSIEVEHAMAVSDNIVETLLESSPEDPHPTPCRMFLEKHGANRMDVLERSLSNFITAADTLRLNNIPYVARTRDTLGWLVVACKDVVESNAARLKGWGELDARVDLQMILLQECAKRLEGMSASAGTDEALAGGCLLTATAKLLRSLHRILLGFKKNVAVLARRRAGDKSSSSTSGMATSSAVPTPSVESLTSVDAGSARPDSKWDNGSADDIFGDWANWPQLDSTDFRDIFANMMDNGANEVNKF